MLTRRPLQPSRQHAMTMTWLHRRRLTMTHKCSGPELLSGFCSVIGSPVRPSMTVAASCRASSLRDLRARSFEQQHRAKRGLEQTPVPTFPTAASMLAERAGRWSPARRSAGRRGEQRNRRGFRPEINFCVNQIRGGPGMIRTARDISETLPRKGCSLCCSRNRSRRPPA